MADKRHLPVINSGPPPPPRQPGGDVQPEAAWHWIPLGAMISIAVGVVLARSFWMPFRQRLVSELYGGAATREEILRADARLSQSARDVVLFKTALAGGLVALVSVVIGGFIVGRFGQGTNRRHGTLAGLTAMVLVVLFASSGVTFAGLPGLILLVVLGGLAGYLGALLGEKLKHRVAGE